MEFDLAPDIQRKLKKVLAGLDFPYIKPNKIVCFRSQGSKSRARARIWSLPRIWQKALRVQPHYCIEILTERFDNLNEKDQTKTLIHELMHIPKNFSGALLPHRGRGKVRIDNRSVDKLYRQYRNNRNNSSRKNKDN